MPLRRDTRVFISAVSKELGTVRKLVKKALEDSGYHAVEQDNFPLDYRALVDKLRRQMESCDAVIHLAGRCYGAEPRERPAETPRRSYTQLEYDLARELETPIYVFVIGEGFPADDCPVEDEEQIRLQQAHRQALTEGGQDYLRAATRQEINDKVRSLQLRIEKAQEELKRVDEKVAATGQHLGRRLAWVLAGVLAVIATLGYLVWSGERQRAEAQTVESVQTEIAERLLDQFLSNKEISAEEARRRALAELPAAVGLSAVAIQQLIDKKIAPRVQDAALSPLERAKAALAAGDYDAVFAEAGKQRAESRELAILEGTAALARFRGDPQPAWNEKALAAFQRALALSDAGAQPLDWAHAAVWVAFVLIDMAQYTEAEPLLRQAVKLLAEELGADAPRVAVAINDLAQLLKATNRLREAEPLMRRALEIDEKRYGSEHPKVAILLSNLAALLHYTNRVKEAEPLMRRALAIDEKSYGPEHPDVAIDLNNLAALLQATNHLAEAEPLMRRALAIDEKSYGPEPPKVAIRLSNLAALLHYTNRVKEAEPLMRRALEIDEKSYGPEHPKVAIRLNNLAQLLKATNRLREAEPLSRRHLAIFLDFTRRTGHPHPHLDAALGNYASILKDLGRSEAEIEAEIGALQRQYRATVD